MALHCGTHGTCPGCTRGPGNLRREGQCVWDCIQHRTLGTFLNLSCKIGPVGFLGIVTENLDKCELILYRAIYHHRVLVLFHTNFLCFPTGPSAPPTSVSASSSSTSITVQWGAVDCIHSNGDIIGYSVRYGVQGNGSTQTESVSGGGATMGLISGLEPMTSYSVEVAAVNSAGSGVYSDPYLILTDSMFYIYIYTYS